MRQARGSKQGLSATACTMQAVHTWADTGAKENYHAGSHAQLQNVPGQQHMEAVHTSRLSAAGDRPFPSRQWTFLVLALKNRQKASPPMPAHLAQLSAHSLTARTSAVVQQQLEQRVSLGARCSHGQQREHQPV